MKCNILNTPFSKIKYERRNLKANFVPSPGILVNPRIFFFYSFHYIIIVTSYIGLRNCAWLDVRGRYKCSCSGSNVMRTDSHGAVKKEATSLTD